MERMSYSHTTKDHAHTLVICLLTMEFCEDVILKAEGECSGMNFTHLT